MPIPAFDGILNALPPHLGDPRQPADLSPFPCTIAELCGRFATTAKRQQILEGFLNLRAELFALGIQGFQWLDGSFMEDIEIQEGRDPNDLDTVTFVIDPVTPADLMARLATKPNLLNHTHVKGTYSVDHYWISIGSDPALLIAQTGYWYGLFSHRRDRVWKGMLVVDLIDMSDDDAARITLGARHEKSYVLEGPSSGAAEALGTCGRRPDCSPAIARTSRRGRERIAGGVAAKR